MQKSFDRIMETHRNVNGQVVLEFGPGDRKWCDNSIGLDIKQKDTVDYVCDLSKGLPFVRDESVDLIYSSHFLEHVDNIQFFLGEVNRVLKRGGKMLGVVPHFSNPYFYSDYTHKNFWGLYTISYFSKDAYFRRRVPKYYNDINFKINQVELCFYSPFFVRRWIKLLFSVLINSSRYMQEFYEEILVGIFHCYEIQFEVEKR